MIAPTDSRPLNHDEWLDAPQEEDLGVKIEQAVRHSMPNYAHLTIDNQIRKRHPSPCLLGLGRLLFFLLKHNWGTWW